ncbi:MAG: hypothetical protein L6R42_002487 [Xanthoria sp. 1 TBL-2021]|nr:MAG: hypothetical protein L6R42_002487 [Xanthoria sp. 1 TBL-2021]
MTSWRQDYLLALQARDRIEQAQKTFYDAYTKLADRAAAADAQKSENATSSPMTEWPAPVQPPKGAPSKASMETSSNAEALAQIQKDLSEAQRSRGTLQSRLQNVSDGLQKSKLQSAIDSKRLDELGTEKAALVRRLKDRDEELRGKAKLLEDVHDETVSLTLQLNMAEDQVQKLKKENEDLVERWMARMGKEANAMNEESKFI